MLLLERLGQTDVGVTGVDADELHALRRGVLGDLGEVRCLGAARRAPGAPHVQDDDLALVVLDVELLAVHGRAGEVGAWTREPLATVEMPSLPATKLLSPEPRTSSRTARGQDKRGDGGPGGEQGGTATGAVRALFGAAGGTHVKSFACPFRGSSAPPCGRKTPFQAASPDPWKWPSRSPCLCRCPNSYRPLAGVAEERLPATRGPLSHVQRPQLGQDLGLLYVHPVHVLPEGDEADVLALLLLPGDVLEGVLDGVHVDAAVPVLEVVADEEGRPVALVGPPESGDVRLARLLPPRRVVVRGRLRRVDRLVGQHVVVHGQHLEAAPREGDRLEGRSHSPCRFCGQTWRPPGEEAS